MNGIDEAIAKATKELARARKMLAEMRRQLP
jgi:hypothetical protein